MSDIEYISEFEEIMKLKEFYKNDKMKMPYLYTYENISEALRNEYIENINEKINRWVNITHVQYFENVELILYYFQAKMLYRDGFYESAIMLARSICEMICYDILPKISHPFGSLELIDVPTFRVFLNFLAMPKVIEKSVFENKIIANVPELDDKNFIKLSYHFNIVNKTYCFKIESGKKNNNLERLFKIFRQVSFNNVDTFKNDTYRFFHEIYDIGNLYVHVKKKQNSAEIDANKCLNMLTHILSDIYGVKASLVGKTIKSGYSDFPDICKGVNFAMEIAMNPDDAQRIYFNFPHPKHAESLKQAVGIWSGEWKNKQQENVKGVLEFFLTAKDYLTANLKYINSDNEETIESLDIKLFGSYFHLKGFDANDMLYKKERHVFFRLEFFNMDLLLGENIDFKGKAIFKRIKYGSVKT